MPAIDQPENDPGASGEAARAVGARRVIVKLLVLGGILASFGWLFLEHRDDLTLHGVAGRKAQFDAFRQEHPVGVYAVALAVYVVVTGLSIPGATVLTLSYAWFFGFWPALLLASLGSTSGATLSFLLSRYLLGGLIQHRFGERLRRFNAALEREGAFYLFSLRLTPIVPFFVINLVMGLTRIRVWTFWWVSQVGMLAGTCLYVYAGAQIPSAAKLAETGLAEIFSPQLIVAFIALGLFPLVAKKLLARFRPLRNDDDR